MGKVENANEFLLENLKERGHSEDLNVDGKISKLNLRKIDCELVDCVPLVQGRVSWQRSF